MKMKFRDFFKYYSYGIVRIFVDQIAIAIFASAVALGTAYKNMPLAIASSVFSILFFMFMVAELTFRQGVEDKEKTEIGRFERNNLTGLYMGLFANVPNFVLALAFLVLKYIPSAQNIAGVVNVIVRLICGEYMGLLAIKVGGAQLGTYPISLFVIMIPGILAAFLGYYLGVSGKIIIKPTKKDLE